MKVAIPSADGQWISCPECGQPALVQPARIQMGTQSIRVASRHGWWLVDCPRSGKKLYPQTQVVELIEPIEPEASHAGSAIPRES